MTGVALLEFKWYLESELHNKECPYECWCLDEFAQKLEREESRDSLHRTIKEVWEENKREIEELKKTLADKGVM